MDGSSDPFWDLALAAPTFRSVNSDVMLQDEDTLSISMRGNEKTDIPDVDFKITEIPFNPKKPERTLLSLRTFNSDLMGHVGEMLWPAGSLLSAYLCQHPGLVVGKRVLDIGSGTGLLGMACARLGAKSVLCTDYLTDVLNNLRYNVQSNGLSDRIAVERLDWSDFSIGDFGALDYLESTLVEASGIASEKGRRVLFDFAADVLIGSALVYSENGAVLADLIHQAMKETAKQAVIVQMRNRIGVDRFLLRIKALGDDYEMAEIPPSVYESVAKTPRLLEENGRSVAELPPRSSFMLLIVKPSQTADCA